jgi:hypothetical protein
LTLCRARFDDWFAWMACAVVLIGKKMKRNAEKKTVVLISYGVDFGQCQQDTSRKHSHRVSANRKYTAEKGNASVDAEAVSTRQTDITLGGSNVERECNRDR